MFPDPTPIQDAIAFVDAILVHEHVVLGALGDEWPLLHDSCIEGRLAGNAIPDAWIAAAVRNLQTTLVTFDRGVVRLLGKHELEILNA